MEIFNKINSRKRQSKDESGRESKNPRIEIINVEDDSAMVIDSNSSADNSYYYNNMTVTRTQFYSQETSRTSVGYITSQEDNELLSEMNRLDIDKERAVGACKITFDIADHLSTARTAVEGASTVAKNFAMFAPLITSFLDIGKEIITLYEKAEHNKELCGSLLKRCNFAMAEVQDLAIRKTEYADFFSKQENFILFKGFIDCMKKIKRFIADASQLNRLKKFLYANTIEENFTRLTAEFEGYMNSLNFSFAMRTKGDITEMKFDMRQIKDLLFHVYGVSDDKQAQQNYFNGMDSVNEKNKEFRARQNKILDSSEFKTLEENEPLLDGRQYLKTSINPSKRIGKRTSSDSCEEFCFKEFSNNSTALGQSSNEETQIEIRRQVNILKELKNSEHIIRFYGVAQEESKYYLVTEWMEHGNLHEYYTKFRDSINLEIKIKFALDICRGVAYLHACRILHHDIQSANILVNEHHKVKIANFGLSKKFSDITRNITHNLENIRYMAPEKLFLDNDENNDDAKRKKVSYDFRCEIYSVGALLWEIAELTKPHSDISSELLVNIRKRVKENYELPFSEDVPFEWKSVVSRAMVFEPEWRIKISDICIELYRLNKKYQTPMPPSSPLPSSPCSNPVTIPTVEEAVREHKSQNGNKRLAWQSFSYHSETDLEAKYWFGYYYYHEEIPELQLISKDERIRIALSIFKETADKGNPSAQLRYGMCLWKGEGVDPDTLEALKYFEMAANSGNVAAMYIIGKAYWNGGNGIERNEKLGADYLKRAALNDHPAAKEMCLEHRLISFN